MKYPDTTEFVFIPEIVQQMGLPERLPTNSLEFWMLIFSLVGMASVLFCIWQASTRMMHSPVRALRVKCWFVLILTIGQGMVAHATMTRAFNGFWEEQFLMTGLSLWLGGRMAVTLYDKINKYRKNRIA
ncbi:MAG: hypothetical protein K0U66_08870 [Gammaproteobacteria bacterium]|nr:hypothetical protein [Gammaproteobacteria bacterium]